MGCSIPFGSHGGAPPGGLLGEGRVFEPKDEGFLASGTTRLGYDNTLLCPRNGLDLFKAFGGRGRLIGEEGGPKRPSAEKEAPLSQEAEIRQGQLSPGCPQHSGGLGSFGSSLDGRDSDDSRAASLGIDSCEHPHVLDLWCGGNNGLSQDLSSVGHLSSQQFCNDLDGSAAMLQPKPSHNPLSHRTSLGSEDSPCKVGCDTSFTGAARHEDSAFQGKRTRHKRPPRPQSGVAEDPGHGADDPWKELQTFSFSPWRRRLCSLVLRTRTPFAAFLKTTLHASRSSSLAPAHALFPLPIPKPGIFEPLPSRCSSQKRRRVAIDRAFHIIVCALNFLHADCSFPSLELMTKEPSKGQKEILWNLRALVRAFGISGETFAVPQSGRRSVHLLAGLSDLSRFATLHGLSSEPYHRGFPGVEGPQSKDDHLVFDRLVPDLSLADELMPYRPLQPERLKLSGKANWDPCPFLGDSFLMPYLEPALLVWTKEFQWDDIPDLNRECPTKTLELAKIWDRNGLLALRPGVMEEDMQPSCLRIFGCLKSRSHDRQIGDRRGRNQIERAIPGPSRFLPVGQSLSVLEVNPSQSRLSICVTDRKDYYHQLKVSRSRAYSNALWPPLPLDRLHCTQAWQDLLEHEASKKHRTREQKGDLLGSLSQKGPVCDKKVSDEKTRKGLPDLGHVCFNSVAQGDHLGVEIATDRHRGLLRSVGLLDPSQEITSDKVWQGQDILQGLVIDDFFSIAITPDNPQVSQVQSRSKAGKVFDEAVSLYKKVGLLGSPEKDVDDATKGKVAGAELDSSQETRNLGLVTLGAPAVKRLALSLVSLELSSRQVTSDSLHCCLLGGWVSAALYRRQFMSVLFHSHHLVDATGVDAARPRVVALPRKVAQELTLLSVLCPLMTVDLSARIQQKVFASDSSDAKGAYVSTDSSEDMARLLWRSGSKKGGYARLQNKIEALARKLEVNEEPFSLSGFPQVQKVKKPIGLRYDFLEICGGAAKVSREMAKRGWNVGPCIDLDRSKHFNLASLELVRWLLHLVEEGLLDSFFVQPPCTTFSPAAFPPLRSYALPYGFSRSCARTKLGNILAFRALTLMLVASRCSVVALLEQSRRSKMAWLPEWVFLREQGLVDENWLASCMYGSIHQKEFRLLGANIQLERLHKKCDRQHTHVTIQGKWTKPSATYTDELAEAFAEEISRSLRAKKSRSSIVDVKTEGLESAVFNDLMVSSRWNLEKVWRWKKPAHINIHETAAVVQCLKDQALSCPRTRFSIGIDSHVALAALAKGRSPSNGLRPIIRRAGMIAIAGSLYPSFHFCPTRLNSSDNPTRDNELPSSQCASFTAGKDLETLAGLSKIAGLRRFASNWARLVLLLLGGRLPWINDHRQSWRFSHYRFSAYPYLWNSARVEKSSVDFSSLDFDSTLGFPGEGPPVALLLGLLFSLSAQCPFTTCVPLFWIWFCFGYPADSSGASWGRVVSISLNCRVFLSCPALAMDTVVRPRDARDRARAGGRHGVSLEAGRPVLEKTQKGREKLLEGFDAWLRGKGLSLEVFLDPSQVDLDMVNLLIERYGRDLFKAGRPYGHYSELINGIASLRPRFRRALQGAWDLAYTWLKHEPGGHHTALPWQALVAMLVGALLWGWVRVAGIIALSWGSLSRIGEVVSATRLKLVLPSDLGFSVDYALLQIEPKTRLRAARHQVARLDQPQLLMILEFAFSRLSKGERLWPFSPQTLRKRFYTLLDALTLPKGASGPSRGLDMGSLRAGGATWLLESSENPELVRRRGRWISAKIMEIYIQESSSAQFVPLLEPAVKEKVLLAVHLFPSVLKRCKFLHEAAVPENAWRHLLLVESLEQ